MDNFFKLPIKKILTDEKSGCASYHYTYYNSPGEVEIIITHIKNICDGTYLEASIYIVEKNKVKNWKISRITKESLKTLQEKINKYLVKVNVNGPFINSWQKCIDKQYERMENLKIVAIEDDEAIRNNGSRFKLLDKSKTIEELNETIINGCLINIDSFKKYILMEDGE